jgi:Raf kinase inhibitor-like YbhB/YbcL family protein
MRFLFRCIGLLALLHGALASAADVMTFSSSSFSDNAVLAARYGGNLASNPNCAGQNISPALTWSHAPAKTQSFAIVMLDPDGRLGLGVVHWVAYGIDPAVTALAEGEAAETTSTKFVEGVGTRGVHAYTGPCAPPGTGLHHFVLTLIATDLPVDALPPGLTREELLTRLDGHALAGTSIVMRSGHVD